MKIRPVGIEVFHADRRTDVTKLIATFRNFATAPQNRHWWVHQCIERRQLVSAPFLLLRELVEDNDLFIHSFSILSDDRSKASSKTMPPYSAMQSLLLQIRISSPVLKVIQ